MWQIFEGKKPMNDQLLLNLISYLHRFKVLPEKQLFVYPSHHFPHAFTKDQTE